VGNGKAKDVKFELRKLADNPDRFERFSISHQKMIRAAADNTFFEKTFDLIELSFPRDLLTRGKTEYATSGEELNQKEIKKPLILRD